MKLTYTFIVFSLFFNMALIGYGQCAPDIYYLDSDGDGFGTMNYDQSDIVIAQIDWIDAGSPQNMISIVNNVAYGCKGPSQYTNYVLSNFDRDDTNPCIIVLTPKNFYIDNDGDGYGNEDVSVYCSNPPPGYVETRTDCDDNDASVFEEQLWYLDADGDGVGGSISQMACHPPAGYVATTGDQCDNEPASLVELVWYPDMDGDGFGGPTALTSCVTPSGHVRNNLDRDDNNPCITDKTPVTYYEDQDGDGYGNPAVSVVCSTPPDGFVVNNTDCDDQDEDAFPGTLWYFDGDGDGFGASSPTVMQCTRPSGYVDNRADYDDSNDKITNTPLARVCDACLFLNISP